LYRSAIAEIKSFFRIVDRARIELATHGYSELPN